MDKWINAERSSFAVNSILSKEHQFKILKKIELILNVKNLNICKKIKDEPTELQNNIIRQVLNSNDSQLLDYLNSILSKRKRFRTLQSLGF